MTNQLSEASQLNNIDYFDLLPQGCIVDMVSCTTPVDACRLALVDSSLRLIADSDAVWERFLPPDYQQVSRAMTQRGHNRDLLSNCAKKELYQYLCDHPLLIDSGAMSICLDKWTGKWCFMIAARELGIAGSDDEENWRWTPDSKSRFSETIVLINSPWFDIHGKIDTWLLSPDMTYTTYLVYKTTFTISGFQDQSVRISVGIIGEECINRTVCLDPKSRVRHRNVTVPPRTRKDGWLEVELAEYYNKEGEDRELGISLKGPTYAKRHSGLIIQGLEIRPKVV
ncbi:Phloem protein 2-6 [Heracleum sosnowskyi]|uniref:Phloem protein 2-6 n=1 Tax=Heracleum sosnowskyi TaxID=360622 RepID=A0AAD8IGB6_9APIA|nr:Phloem protein 2-6 [Heracleum sosnowskyi]